MKQINFLKDSEIQKFDLPPELTDEERQLVFTTRDILDHNLSFRKTITKIGFILQMGYFTLKRKFFLPYQFHKDDINFVIRLLDIKHSISISEYKKVAYNLHRKLILELNGYRKFSEFKKSFIQEAESLVKTSLKPKDIFYSLLDYLEERKVEIPKYYVFSNVVSEALNSFESILVKQIDKDLTKSQKETLDSLMILPSNPDKLSSNNPYLITSLKKPEQGITPKKIRESLEDFYIIQDLHFTFLPAITTTDISKELLNYYAVWLIKAEHIQFESISNIEIKRLYLIAFIVYQFRLRQDLFTEIVLQCVPKYFNDTEKIVATQFLNQTIDQNSQKKSRFSNIRNIILSSKQQMTKVKEIIISNNYQDTEKVEKITQLLFKKENSFQDKLLEELSKIDPFNIKGIKDQLFFTQLSKGFRKIQNRVGNIIQILEFNPNTSNLEIISAINYYKDKKGKITNYAPTEFVSEKDNKWLFDEKGELDKSLYKVILYREISNHIKAGSLILKYSDKYKSIDEYLISSEKWNSSKSELIERANLKEFKCVKGFLTNFKNILSDQYLKTNQGIGDNTNLKIGKDGKPRITTPKLNDVDTNNGCIEVLGSDQYLPLINILSEIRHTTKIGDVFVHYSRKTFKNNLSDDVLYAAIIGLGCNIGIRKMGKISKGIGADKLEYAVRWYFSKENLDEANRRILALINNLSLPKIFSKDKLHTSSDGQKFNVSIPSLHARYSYKYFGFGKGVSAYSFIDDQSKLFYNTIISTSEREAGYVLDGLMHNDEIESNIHSTDTHGYSEIVFGICNSLGIFFAPRIKNHKNQLLYTFKSHPRKNYQQKGYQILPAKGMQIDETILDTQWDNVIRLLCTIKLKEVRASEILSRLSSYSKQHPLYKALKELGRIYKTIFLLRYYSETPLRQAIEKQLNKVELSHLFAKAVFFGNNQEFKVSTKEEQEIALSCRHLIQNSIILWNYLFISEKLSKIESKQEYDRIIDILKQSSVMTWQHINMHGEYDFEISNKESKFDLKSILEFQI